LVFIDGGLLGRGIRVLGGVVHQTARGEAMLGPDSSKTTSDRWAPPVSVLRRPAAYRFGRAGLSSPGPFLGLGQLVSPQPFSIWKRISFPILKQICFIFVIKLAQFETLQICKIL
jgi:hypothetical protein